MDDEQLAKAMTLLGRISSVLRYYVPKGKNAVPSLVISFDEMNWEDKSNLFKSPRDLRSKEFFLMQNVTFLYFDIVQTWYEPDRRFGSIEEMVDMAISNLTELQKYGHVETFTNQLIPLFSELKSLR